MLYTSHHLIDIIDIVSPLITMDISLRDLASEIRVLACPLYDSAPTGITGNVHHRAEHPIDAGSRSFTGRHPDSLLDKLRIPRCAHGKRNRKDSFMSMDNVAAHDQRNARARFHRNFLKLAKIAYIGRAIDSSQLARSEQLHICIVLGYFQCRDKASCRMKV